MKNVGLSLITVALCSLYGAQNVTLDAVSIEEEKNVETLTLGSENTKILLQNEAVSVATIDEALKKQFFVTDIKSGDYSSEPYIRGRGTKGVPLYLEGMRVNAAHPDSTNLFNMIDVEAVEVYRGASGVSVGMGAMSGGIVVRYKKPRFFHF